MTNEEAIKEFYLLKKARIFIPSNNTIDVAIKALEKQIPKEIEQDIVNGKMNRKCPNGCNITGVTMWATLNYCPYCGKAIKE